MNVSLSPFVLEKSVSRDGFGRPVSRQPTRSLYSGQIWCLLTRFLPISAAPSIYLYHQTPSGQSRVYRVTQLRADGVHCRESADTGPVVILKAYPFSILRLNMVLTHEIPPNFRGGVHLFIPSNTIGSVPSLSSYAIACRWRSLPRRHGASSNPQGSSSNNVCCFCLTSLSFPAPTIGMECAC